MQHKVWDKAANDKDGLQSYFDSHKTKYTFKELSSNRGLVMSDYQDYLEDTELLHVQSD